MQEDEFPMIESPSNKVTAANANQNFSYYSPAIK